MRVIALWSVGRFAHHRFMCIFIIVSTFFTHHQFNLYFVCEFCAFFLSLSAKTKNLFDILCESAFSKQKCQLFCIAMQTSTHPKQTHFVWNSSTSVEWRYLCGSICVCECTIYFHSALCFVQQFLFLFGAGKLLWYALAIAFSIPMLLHWIHISLMKIASLVRCTHARIHSQSHKH